MKGAHDATRLKDIISDLSTRRVYSLGGETDAVQAPNFLFESIGVSKAFAAVLPVFPVATVQERERDNITQASTTYVCTNWIRRIQVRLCESHQSSRFSLAFARLREVRYRYQFQSICMCAAVRGSQNCDGLIINPTISKHARAIDFLIAEKISSMYDGNGYRRS